MLSRSFLLIILGLCFYGTSINTYADNDDLEHLQIKLTNEWQLIKHDKRRNIKTYAKQEDGRPFRSFKVESTLNGSMKDVVRILADFDNYKKWYWQTIDSKLLKTVSPTEHYVYMTHNAPYGLTDRDAVLKIKVLLQTPEKPQLAFLIEAVPDFMAINKDFIRINAEDMLLSLKPLTYNSIQLIAEGYIDPGGKFPNWAGNVIQRTAPYSVLLGLQRMLAQKHNSKVVIPFSVLEITDY